MANFDTTLNSTSNSFECKLLDTAIIGDSAIKIDDTDISPAPAGGYEVAVCDDQGNEVIRFSEPHNNVAGNYPANSGSTFPLPGGTYYPKIIVGGVAKPMEPICIKPWDICEQFVQLNYDGLVSGSSQVVTLPVNPSATSLETQFSSFTVSDRFIIRDCTGAVIHDSGNISVVGDQVDVPLAGFDISCGTVDVEIIPDPAAPAGQVTIYSLAVGCCLQSDPVVLPRRHPVAWLTGTECLPSFNLIPPHSHFPGQRCFVESLLDQCAGGGCIYGFEDANFLFSASFGCDTPITQVSSCLDFPVAATRNVSVAGAVVTIDTFSTTAAYTMAKNFFTQIASEQPAGKPYVQLRTNKDVNCGDDGVTLNIAGFWNFAACVIFDDVAESVVVNYTGKDVSHAQPCCKREATAEEMASELAATIATLGQTGLRIFFPDTGPRLSPAGWSETTPGSGVYTRKINLGIKESACTHSNPPEDWELFWDVENGTFQVLDAAGNLVNDETSTVGPALSTASDICTRLVPLKQCQAPNATVEVTDATIAGATFDLTYYGGGSAETFATLADYYARFVVLSGVTGQIDPWNGAILTDAPNGNLKPVCVTGF